jgi:hypothetical protein
MAPLLCIRLRQDLQSDFLTCARTFQHQWLLCSALDWILAPRYKVLASSTKIDKDIKATKTRFGFNRDQRHT